jgi:hypothetical protein
MNISGVLAGSISVAVLLGAAAPAEATIVQYIYAGQDYNTFQNSPVYTNPYSTSTRVTGEFEINTSYITPDADPSFDLFDGAVFLLTSYYFTDGVTAVSSADPASGVLSLGGILFNLDGSIAGYDLSVETLGYPSSYPYGTIEIDGASPAPNTPFYSGEDDSGTSFVYESTPLGVGGDIQAPGAWSGPFIISGVPETATWAMMLVGLGSIGASMRIAQRKRGAA